MSVNKIRLIALAYFAFAVVLRFLPHGVNFTAIGALALFAGCYLSVAEGALMAVGAMALTDTLGHWLDVGHMGLYHRPTMFAVYACTALPSLLGWLMQRGKANVVTVPAAAIGSSVVFFLATNFAAWLDPQMHYPQTFAGLIQSYIAAIPFAGNQFLGTLIFSCAFFAVYAVVQRRVGSPTMAAQRTQQ